MDIFFLLTVQLYYLNNMYIPIHLSPEIKNFNANISNEYLIVSPYFSNFEQIERLYTSLSNYYVKEHIFHRKKLRELILCKCNHIHY